MINFLRKSSSSFSKSALYTLYGAVFGLMFPVFATIALLLNGSQGVFEAQLDGGVLIWMIDTAPLFLGLFARQAGIRQDSVERLTEQLEGRLKESQSDRAHIVHSSTQLIFFIDRNDLHVLEANPAAQEAIGHSIEELSQQEALSFVNNIDKEQFRQTVQPLEEGKGKVVVRTHFLRKDEEPFPVEVVLESTVFMGRHGYLAIATDRSEQEEHQTQMMRASKLASIGELSAGVGHEINNPLLVVANAANKMASEVVNPTEAFNKSFHRLQIATSRI